MSKPGLPTHRLQNWKLGPVQPLGTGDYRRRSGLHHSSIMATTTTVTARTVSATCRGKVMVVVQVASDEPGIDGGGCGP